MTHLLVVVSNSFSSQDKMKFIPKALLMMMVGSLSSSVSKSSSGWEQVAAYANRSKFRNRGIYIGDVCAIITSSEEGIDAKVAGLCDGQNVPSFAKENEVPKDLKFNYNKMPEKGLISVKCGDDFTYVAISGSKADPFRNYLKKGERKLDKTALYSICRFVSIRLPSLPIEIKLISDGNDMPKISMSDLRVDNKNGEIVADLTLEKIERQTQCSLKLTLLDKDMKMLRSVFFSSKKEKFFEIVGKFFGTNKVCLHLTTDVRSDAELALYTGDVQAQILADHSGSKNTITCYSRKEKSILAEYFTFSDPFASFCDAKVGVDTKACYNRKATDFCELALFLEMKFAHEVAMSSIRITT